MNNYLVFKIDQYYPSGGMSDLIGDFDTLEEATLFADKQEQDRYSMIDIFSLKDKKSIDYFAPNKE